MFHHDKKAFGSFSWDYRNLSHIERTLIEEAAASIRDLLDAGSIGANIDLRVLADRVNISERLVRPALRHALNIRAAGAPVKQKVAESRPKRRYRTGRKGIGSAEVHVSDAELRVILEVIKASPRSTGGFSIVDRKALAEKLGRSFSMTSRMMRKSCRQLGFLVQGNMVSIPPDEKS